MSTAKAERINLASWVPSQLKAAQALEASCAQGPLNLAFLELVRLHVSELNHCTYCIWLHQKKASEVGVSLEKQNALAQWSTSALFDAKEKIALQWAEQLTLETSSPPPLQALYDQLSEAGTAQLAVVISMINFWNRLMKASGQEAG